MDNCENVTNRIELVSLDTINLVGMQYLKKLAKMLDLTLAGLLLKQYSILLYGVRIGVLFLCGEIYTECWPETRLRGEVEWAQTAGRGDRSGASYKKNRKRQLNNCNLTTFDEILRRWNTDNVTTYSIFWWEFHCEVLDLLHVNL